MIGSYVYKSPKKPPIQITVQDPDGGLHGSGEIVASADAIRNPLYYEIRGLPLPGKKQS